MIDGCFESIVEVEIGSVVVEEPYTNDEMRDVCFTYGFPLTVKAYDGERVWCEWENARGEKYRTSLPPGRLRPTSYRLVKTA
jgi:hypothetical protein